jgi:hypothetical protein
MNNDQHSAPTAEAAFSGSSYSPRLPIERDGRSGALLSTAHDELSREGTASADVCYDRWRASEERTAALQARDLRARRVHIELAERYEERVRNSAAAQLALAVAPAGELPVRAF